MIEVDERDLPILRVRWPAVAVGPDDLERFARTMERIHGARGRVAVVVDATHAAPIGPRAMAAIARIERRSQPAALACRAIVVPSALARRVLAAAIRAIPHQVPTRAFDDAAAAEAWARAQI